MAKSLPYELGASNLRIEVEMHDDRAVVRLSGELDASSATGADEAFEYVRRRKWVQLDLSELQSLDRAGLAPILRLRTILEARGGRVDVVGATGTVATVVRLGMGSAAPAPTGSRSTSLFRSNRSLDPPA